MKKFLLILKCLGLIVILAGCSNDNSIDFNNNTESYIPPKVQYTQCYTIRINGIDEDGIVSGSIINKPEKSSLTGHCIIIFEKSDLSGLNVDNNDEIDVKILSFKKASVEGFTTGETHFYYCKVNICK